MFNMNGELAHQITRGEWALRASGGLAGLNRSVAHIDEDDHWIYFTSLEKASTERHLYRIRFDGSDMQRVSNEAGSHAIYFQAAGNYYLDRSSALNRLPRLFCTDHRASRSQPLLLPTIRFRNGLICNRGNS